MLLISNTIVDCVWNDWEEGDCSVTCGVGIRNIARTKKVTEKHGGKCCCRESFYQVECDTTIKCPPCKFIITEMFVITM